MEIFVYSDESGVFDKKKNKPENNFFIFSGIIFLSRSDRDNFNREFLKAEKKIREKINIDNNIDNKEELKACTLSNKHKLSLFKLTNKCYRFSAIIDKSKVMNSIYESKKTRQRFLDYAYKISLKRAFEKLISKGIINPSEVKKLYVTVDEHTTATDGRYELREGLEQEFKIGTFNSDYNIFFPPIFRNIEVVNLNFANSSKRPLIRACDIIANRIFYLARNNESMVKKDNLFITYLPLELRK